MRGRVERGGSQREIETEREMRGRVERGGSQRETATER